MFAKLSLYSIFLSLFISSVSFSMHDSRKNSVDSIDTDFQNINLQYDEHHRLQGEYSKPEEINSELYNQIIETAPKRVKLLIRGLIRNREEDLDLQSLDNVLLYGEIGNGKTLLARAMSIAAFSKYYYMSTHYALSSCEGCRNQFASEIDYLIQKKEPIAVILDNIICNSSHSYRYNFLASIMNKCAWNAPFLFIIGITSNEIGDFPDVLTNRFKYNKIHIPYPNLLTRNQIISHCLNKNEHTLTTNDIAEFTERLNGRTCRNIQGLIDDAALFSFDNNMIITLEEIKHAEEENLYEPSKHELLAQKFNISIERAQELWSTKHIFKKHRTIIQYLYLERLYTLEKTQFGQTADVIKFEQIYNTTLTVDENANIVELIAQLDNSKLLLDAEEYMTKKDELLFGYTK